MPETVTTPLRSFSRLFSASRPPPPQSRRNRSCILKSKVLLTRQDAADGTDAGPTAGGRNLNHMGQRCRRGPLGRGPLSLAATAILLREDRNRDSLLQFKALQQRVRKTLIRVALQRVCVGSAMFSIPT